jgi:carbonic anhydrase
MADNDNIRALLNSNAKWAADVSEADPDFFPESAKNQQTPHVRPLSTLLFTT